MGRVEKSVVGGGGAGQRQLWSGLPRIEKVSCIHTEESENASGAGEM